MKIELLEVFPIDCVKLLRLLQIAEDYKVEIKATSIDRIATDSRLAMLALRDNRHCKLRGLSAQSTATNKPAIPPN